MEKEVAIHINNLTIGYQNQRQFVELKSEISLKIYRAELVAIVGSNGTGKSTLLKSLSREIKYLGSVKLFDKDLTELNPLDLAKNLSSIGTHYQIQSYTKVKEVIAKGRSIHTNWVGRINEQDDKIVRTSANKVGITHLLDRFYNTLSDGEKQRTLIAMSLAQQSKIVLLDEPTAFIDYPNKYFLSSLLKNMTQEENKTVLFSSHDLDVVLSYADRIILFSNNEVELLSKAEFLTKHNVAKLFERDQLSSSFKNSLIDELIKTYSKV